MVAPFYDGCNVAPFCNSLFVLQNHWPVFLNYKYECGSKRWQLPGRDNSLFVLQNHWPVFLNYKYECGSKRWQLPGRDERMNYFSFKIIFSFFSSGRSLKI